MTAETLLAGAATAAVAGVGTLRLAWSRPRRSTVLNGAGWAFLLLATVFSAAHSGAWGITVAALIAMTAALLVLAHAALLSPAAPGARVSNRRVRMLPEGNEPLQLGRRIATFLLVAIAAALVSTAVAIGCRAVSLLLGATEADANVIALAATPLAWTILSYALLMRETRAAQLRLLLGWAIAGALGVALDLLA